MSYLFYAVFLLGFLFPRSKKVLFMELAAAVLLFGGYCGNLDLNNYRWQYNTDFVTSGYTQKIFSVFAITFHKLGFSFEFFHFMLTVTALAAIAWCICRFSAQPAYAAGIVCTFSLIESGWQMRTLMATGAAVAALCWYYLKIYRQGKSLAKNYIIFILLVMAAVQCHYMAAFFIVFLPLKKINDKQLFKMVLFFIAAVFIFADSLIKASVLLIPEMGKYLGHIHLWSTAVTIAWQLIGTVIVLFSKKRNADAFEQFVKQGTVLMMLLIPFYSYTTIVTRIFRIWIVFIAVYISRLKRNGSIVNVNRLIYDCYNFGSVFYFFYFVQRFRGYGPTILELLNNNMFG